MGNFEEQYCALCHSSICSGNLKTIENVTKDILEVISPKLNLVVDGTQLMCDVCSLKVIEAFKFKSMCLYTDNTIVPYVDDETECSVDLKEIYAKEKGIEPLLELLNQRKICRFCMQLIRGEFVSECDVNVDMIDSYIPEINFSIVEDPTVCKQCFDSLDSHSSFVRKCLEKEQKVKSSLLSCIKTEEIEIKSEANEKEEELSQIGSTVVKSENEKVSVKTENIKIETEENNKSNRPKLMSYRCHRCPFTTWKKSRFDGHITTHMTLEECAEINSLFKCHDCWYRTKRKYSLIRHFKEVHRLAYVCEKCNYQTNSGLSFKLHVQTEHNNNLISYACNECPYIAFTKIKLHQHVKTHDLQHIILKCSHCEFETREVVHLNEHRMCHKHMKVGKLYKCEMCPYQAKKKTSISRHVLTHFTKKQLSAKLHGCSMCHYKCKRKDSLASHIRNRHRIQHAKNRGS